MNDKRHFTKVMSDRALIVFIKNPVKGQVKTRLAKTLGDDAALAIYLQLTEITRQNIEGIEDIQTYVFYTGSILQEDSWQGNHIQKRSQVGINLGERMLNAFDEVFKQHRHICIIGSDCPTLSTCVLLAAFDKLQASDFVIGPSSDGGYYLLGISKDNGITSPPAYLFQNIAWSTASVLPETVKRIAERQHSVVFLEELTDVDEEQDWLIFLNSRQIK